MGGQISPSLMCVDFMQLEPTLRTLEQAKVEYLHMDIMDGRFVPNFTLGPDFVHSVRGTVSIPMDIHLMVEDPERHLELFDIQPGDIVSVHQEACTHLQRVLRQIRSYGARASVALNPATPIWTIEDVLDDLDVILIMTVNPGFAGQRLIPATLNKLKRLKAWLREQGRDQIEVEVDGNVTFDHAVQMRAAGADIFVAGTSSLFQPGASIEVQARRLRQAIE